MLKLKNDMVSDKLSLLEKDLSLMSSFMSRFPDVKDKGARLGDNYDWIIFENFPIPPVALVEGKKITYPQPFDDFLIVIHDYPLFPPRGVLFNKQSPNSEIYEEYTLRVNDFGSLFEVGKKWDYQVEELQSLGWFYADFHYKNFEWEYDLQDIASGQNLCEYMTLLHHRLGGLKI